MTMYSPLPAAWQERILSSPDDGVRDLRLLPVLARLAAIPDERILITIDGPCGSGKSTLARELAYVLEAPVVHMDDFSVPMDMKTPERFAIPGGNLHIERFCEEFLMPWLQEGSGSYRPFLCHEDQFAPPVMIPAARFTIIEGSYCNLPPIREHASLRLFVAVDAEEQQERLLRRGGEERLRMFNERWIPLEQAYHAAFGLPDAGCLQVSGHYVGRGE